MGYERVRAKYIYMDPQMTEYLIVIWPNGDTETFKSIHIEKKGGQ